MGIVKYSLDPEHPPVAGQDNSGIGLSEEEITAAAAGDPDNPPLTDQELARIALARSIRRVRWDVGLSQDAFAERYGIPVATLRQREMGR